MMSRLKKLALWAFVIAGAAMIIAASFLAMGAEIR